MGAMPNEPSMEEILSSIKRIIAEEDSPAQSPRISRRAAMSVVRSVDAADVASDDQVLELTDALPGDTAAGTVSEEEEPVMTAPRPTPAPAAGKKAESKGGSARSRAAVPPSAQNGAAAESAPDPATVMSDAPANAARESLIHLSQLLIRPEDGASNTLEGLVREMLRPMLKEWLDTHLPEIVEVMVKREIDRITGRV